MIEFKRYPHVMDLMRHYAAQHRNQRVLQLFDDDVVSADDAEALSQFVWHMTDLMAADCEAHVRVLGGVDNSEMLPDVGYEVGLYLHRRGFEHVWDRVCDQASLLSSFTYAKISPG